MTSDKISSKRENKRLLIFIKNRIQKYVRCILKIDSNNLTFNKSIKEYILHHNIVIEGDVDSWLLKDHYSNKKLFYNTSIPRPIKVKKPKKTLNTFKNRPKCNGFYYSKEWELIRSLTLKKYGCVCMKCKAKNTEMHVDHIKPRSKYPHIELDENNLQVLCRDCNMEKSNKNEIDYRPTRSEL